MSRILIVAAVSMFVAGSSFAQQPAPGKDMKDMEMKGEMKGMGGMKGDMKGMGGMKGDMKDMGMGMKMMPNKDDPAATAGYKAAMMKMMMEMPAFTGNADIDFMKQMRPHHVAAVDMAKVVLANGKNAETKKLAEDIIAAQNKEIEMIDAWLKKNPS